MNPWTLMRAGGLVLAVLAVLVPQRAHAYAFMCNSIDAHGNVHSDNCSSCTLANAPRWTSNRIDWRVKRTSIPAISGADWLAAAHQSIDAWNNVTCSDFVMQDLGDVANPDLGSNAAQQTIWWITDRAKLQELVGADWQSVLGATLAPYYIQANCSSRVFHDADIMMNGAADHKWTVNMPTCSGYYCIHVVSTLVHEIGHAFGLGHPCIEAAQCPAGGSIMAAIAQPRMDLTQPLQDDVNGLCALYPGAQGGLGTVCTSNTNCNSGLTCQDDNGVKYCTQACGTCPQGWTCRSGYCRRAVPVVGETCTGTCVTGALCLQDSETTYHCYQQCNPSASTSGCPNGQRCYDLSEDRSVGACVVSRQPGETCGNRFGMCRDGATCYLTSNASAGASCTVDTGCAADQICYKAQGATTGNCVGTICLQDCTTAAQCPSGQRCSIEPNETTGSCMGARKENQPCGDGTLDAVCDAGLRCLCADQNCASAFCVRECTNDSTLCLNGWRCKQLNSGDPLKVCLEVKAEGQVCSASVCGAGLICIRDELDSAHCYRDCAQQPCPNDMWCHVYNEGTANQFSVCEPGSASSSGPLASSGSSGGTVSTSGTGSGTSTSGAHSSGSGFSGGGGLPYGQPCSLGTDCQSGICVSISTGNRICVSSCDPRLGHYDCNHLPAADHEGCVPNDANNLGRGGQCIPGAQTGAKDVGEACGSPSECKTGICQGGKCLVWCEAGSGDCGKLEAEGYSCDSSEVSPGVCRPGSGGSATKPSLPDCSCATTPGSPWSSESFVVFLGIGLWAARRRKMRA